MLGREEVVIEDVLVEKVLLLLSDELGRLRGAQRELEACEVAVPPAPQAGDETVVNDGLVPVDDEVVLNPVVLRNRPKKASERGGAP